MSFERKPGAATLNAFGSGAAGIGMGVGKQTLTQQLAMPNMIQNQPALDASGGQNPIAASIRRTLNGYQEIEASVALPDRGAADPWSSPGAGSAKAKIPYWNTRYTSADSTKSRDAPEGFVAEGRDERLARVGVKPDMPVAMGRGTIGAITDAVRSAIAVGEIQRPQLGVDADDEVWLDHWGAAMEAWFLRDGIGLDCAGFAFQALRNACNDTGAVATGKDGDDRTRTGILDGFPSSDTAFSDEDMQTYGKIIEPPKYPLAPGDTMYTADGDGHVRVVIDVAISGLVMAFTTAECTTDPATATDPSTGPRQQSWRFNDQALEHKRDEDGQWHAYTAKDAPAFRRHIVPGTGKPAAAT